MAWASGSCRQPRGPPAPRRRIRTRAPWWPWSARATFDLLLSADAESGSLLPLDLPDVDAMKVPHHGSADPGLPAVLSRLRPEMAAIEVGENTYGHPAPPTLAALARSGARVYRTDRQGTITLTVSDGDVEVETER